MKIDLTDPNIEALARLICQSDGLDPDRKTKGLGYLAPVDTTYPLWHTRIHYAHAIIAAGWKPPRKKKGKNVTE